MATDSPLLHWLPAHPNFRAALRQARVETAPERKIAGLRALAEHRLDVLETLQLDRVLADAFEQTPAALRPVKLAILAASTVDHLLPAIRIGGLRRGLWLSLQTGAYGQFRQEVAERNSALYRFRPDVVLFTRDVASMLGEIPLATSAEAVGERMAAVAEDCRSLWAMVRQYLGAAIIQQNCLNTADTIFGQFDAVVDAAPATTIDSLNAKLAAVAKLNGVHLLDVARSSRQRGVDLWFDPVRWFDAKQEIAPIVAPLYGDLVARVIAAELGLSRKCLVLDLDNTLWGGVVGDDGIDGIVLGPGNPLGEAFAAFQTYVKRLGERGVILAVCSKNEPAIVEAAFREHPEMILRQSDIAAFAVNWQDKASNLREIAARLNIGIDSLVFFDDNPVERASVRERLPMVAVPEVPDDPAAFARCLADAGYFEAVAFTGEDRQRTRQYVANAERESAGSSASNMDDFLRGLAMRMDARPFASVDIARITQLVNKTNQFNLRTQRYTQQRIVEAAADPAALTLQVRVADRFGDNGLIAVAILHPEARTGGSLFIETWLMSCRVIGRGVEQEMCNRLVAAAGARGVAWLVGEHIPTAKNALVRNLFAELGFRRIEHEHSDGTTRWELRLADYVPHRTWFLDATAAAK